MVDLQSQYKHIKSKVDFDVINVIENELEVFDIDYQWQFEAAEQLYRCSKNGLNL